MVRVRPSRFAPGTAGAATTGGVTSAAGGTDDWMGRAIALVIGSAGTG